ncbi:MAG: Ca(2+)/H(+) antiporter [uncultured Solirubrobacteraceae bacterium]|uniref:Ca(2+)/H(+) antiporter n=1 Tax=uncultured Solirubrobacteraceae bacterium TaxID=1162706 RepID=A0A6J4SN39_9ACTN|nr:MAG: Ca(2+)/H(+) antiporter [uncultured Solirubrobacteraceae bacterium]
MSQAPVEPRPTHESPTGPDRSGNDGHERRGLFGFLFSGEGWPYLLVPFIVIAFVLEFILHYDNANVLFATSALGVIPTAALMGRATEELAERAGPGIGGLMNVTFGNLPELIIAFIALNAGLYEVVKASVIGSILGNALLVLGASMLVGGLKNRTQEFSPKAASAQATMLILAGVALLIPAILWGISGGSLPVPGEEDPAFSSDIETVSFLVAAVLLATYAGGLLFSLRTHRDLFNPEAESGEHAEVGHQPWSVKKAVILLAIAGMAVGLMSEILVHSISETAENVGVSEFFVGVIVVAVVGNAAEHWVAILVAYKNKMDLAVNIAIGSAAQVALFVGPLLVILSFFFGPTPMPLVFNALEIAGILLAVFAASYIAGSGESTWFEGLMLLALYVVLGVTFFFT